MPDISVGVQVAGADQAANSLKQVADATKNLQSVCSSTASQLGLVGDAASNAATQAGTAASKFGTFGSVLKTQAAAITGVVGSGFMLFNMYDSVTDAQDRVNAGSTRLAQAQLRAEKAHDAVVKAVAKYGPASKEAAQAMQNEENMQGRVAIMSNQLKNDQEDLARAMGNMAQNAVPALAIAFSSVIQVISTFAGKIPAVGNALERLSYLSVNVKGLGTAFEGLGTSMSGFITSHPYITAAIIAISAAVILLRTNMFGLRDRLNDAGVALGNAVPQARGFLVELGKLGETLLGTSTKAKQTGTAVGESGAQAAGAKAGVSSLGEAIKQMGQDQITARNQANELWNSIKQGVAAGSIAMKGLDVSTLEEKLPEAARASKDAINQVQAAVNAYNEEFKKTHNATSAMIAAQGAFNETLQGTSQASGGANEALIRLINTTKWLTTGKVVEGPLGMLSSPETQQKLGLTTEKVNAIGSAVTAIPPKKTVEIEVKTPAAGAIVLPDISNAIKQIADNPAWKTLQDQWDKAFAVQDIAPKVRQATGQFFTAIETAFRNFKWPDLPQLVWNLPDIAAMVMPSLVAGGVAITKEVGTWPEKVATAIQTGAPQLGTAFGSWVAGIPGWLTNGGIAVLNTVGTWITGVGARIMQGATQLRQGFDTWVAGIPGWLINGGIAIGNAVGGWITGVGARIMQGATQLRQGFDTWIAGIPGWLINGGIAIGNAVSGWVTGVGTRIVQGATQLRQGFDTWVAGIPGWLMNGGIAVSNAVSGWITNVGRSIIQGATQLRQGFDTWIAGIGSWLANGGYAIGNAIMSWPQGAMASIKTAGKTIGDAIWGAIKQAVGIAASVGSLLAGITIKAQTGGTFVLTGDTANKIQQIINARKKLEASKAPPTGGGTSTAPLVINPYSGRATNVAPPAPAGYGMGTKPANAAPPASVGGLSFAGINAPKGTFSISMPTNVPPPAHVGGLSKSTGPTRMARGGQAIVSSPTHIGNLVVGEGYRPELLTYAPMSSNAGLLVVTPLTGPHAPSQNRAQHGGRYLMSGFSRGMETAAAAAAGGHPDASKLMTMMEKIIAMQTQARLGGEPHINLMVDGQRMASVTTRYMGNRSYGDR